MENDWLKKGLDFEDAIEVLIERMHSVYGSVKQIREGLYSISAGHWSGNERAINTFNNMYKTKYLVCILGGEHYIYSNKPEKYKDRIMKAIKYKHLDNLDVSIVVSNFLKGMGYDVLCYEKDYGLEITLYDASSVKYGLLKKIDYLLRGVDNISITEYRGGIVLKCYYKK